MSKNNEYITPFENLTKNKWVKLEHIARYLFALDIIRDRFDNPPKIFDIGCGNGYGTSILADSVEKSIAIDISQEAIETGRKQVQQNNVQFKKIDLDQNSKEIQQLAGDKKVEGIIGFEVLEHLRNPRKVLEKISQTIRPGGLFIGSVPNSKYESLDSEGNPKNPHHLQTFTFEKFENILSAAGFRNITFYGQPEPNLKVLQGKDSSENKNEEADISRKEKIKRARKLAFPGKNNIEKSYSIIAVAQCK